MTTGRPDAIFQIGDLLNNTYRIEAVLGRGGTSEVYRARSEISGHQVALKALRSEFSRNEDFLTLMTREEAIREIRHDAIVRYFHNQRTATGVVFLIMDYVDGVGLDRKLKEGGMSGPDLLVVAERVCRGLQAAHAKNITHRDLSPDNIILRGGDPAEAVIIDFGIAKDSNPGAETIVGNEFAGKYAYAAPEQLSGQSDRRADIYALGALLLATFRGRAPDVGNNPMEVIQNKARPLDTSGVPEPLKTLIDRMTDPNRETRLQDVGEVLTLLKGGDADDDETTVIAPLPAAARNAKTIPPTRPVVEPRKARKGRAPLFAVLAVLVLVAAGAGAWFSGLFDPKLPVVDPFTLTVSRAADSPPVAVGHVPSQAMAEAMAAQLGAGADLSQLGVATGPIDEDWPTGVTTMLNLLAPLDSYRLAISNDEAEATGSTENAQLHAQLDAALADPDIASGLVVEAAIELVLRFLPVAEVNTILESLGDCGELAVLTAPPTGFAPESDIVVVGRVARPETRSALRERIADIAGDREVRIETEVLNPTLCTIDAALPRAPAAGFDIAFSQGETGAANPSGRFLVGDNPVIDVTIPSDVTTGYLMVVALDVSGNVFHLLPNKNRPDNAVASLRNGATGPVTIRVAFSLDHSRATEGRDLAFEVDDTSLGKTKILVIHSDEPMLDGLRPTTESAEGYAAALAERQGPVRSLDSRILTTDMP